MEQQLFRYQFKDSIAMADAEATFVLSLFAVEALHGESETRLLAEHAMDLEQRSCVVDASTALGHDLNRLFVGFLTREFGPGSFHVERIDPMTKTTAQGQGGRFDA